MVLKIRLTYWKVTSAAKIWEKIIRMAVIGDFIPSNTSSIGL